MALEAWALLTLEEARDVVDTASPSDDLLLEDLVNAATLACEGETSRKLASRTYTDERYDGTGSVALTLREYPVTSVSAWSILTVNAPEVWTAQSLVTFPVVIHQPTSQMIVSRNTYFVRGVQNHKLTYVAGLASIPAALKAACRQILLSLWKAKDRQLAGIASQSFAGQTTTYIDEAIPKSARLLLSPYRRVPV